MDFRLRDQSVTRWEQNSNTNTNTNKQTNRHKAAAQTSTVWTNCSFSDLYLIVIYILNLPEMKLWVWICGLLCTNRMTHLSCFCNPSLTSFLLKHETLDLNFAIALVVKETKTQKHVSASRDRSKFKERGAEKLWCASKRTHLCWACMM